MHRKLRLFILLLAAMSVTRLAQSAIVWNVGRDDNQWNLTGTGGGPSAVFVQEQGVVSPLPGNPSNAPTTPPTQSADNDYYFSGVYSTVIPSVESFYGPYTPVGVVSANEEAAERAFAGGDLDLRYHFNLTAADINNQLLSITFDALNLDTDNGGTPPLPTDPRHGVEVYFNGVLVMPQLVIRPAQLNQPITTPLFNPATVDARAGPGADNIVSLVGINYSGAGGGNWMGVDYIQLNSEPIPEPSTALMMVCGALGVVPFLRRRS